MHKMLLHVVKIQMNVDDDGVGGVGMATNTLNQNNNMTKMHIKRYNAEEKCR